jgi:hypothetical protein
MKTVSILYYCDTDTNLEHRQKVYQVHVRDIIETRKRFAEDCGDIRSATGSVLVNKVNRGRKKAFTYNIHPSTNLIQSTSRTFMSALDTSILQDPLKFAISMAQVAPRSESLASTLQVASR